MTAEYDGPIFDSTYTSGHEHGVVVPDRYLQIPQGRIADMVINSPGMAEHDSVMRDISSGHRFINTFDDQARLITREELHKKPFICRIHAEVGKTSFIGYALDYRRVRNLMYPAIELDYDPAMGIESIRKHHQFRGTVLANIAVMRYAGEVHYLGDRQLTDHARQFVESVDQVVDEGFVEGKDHISSPAYHDESTFDYHRPDDVGAVVFTNGFGSRNRIQ